MEGGSKMGRMTVTGGWRAGRKGLWGWGILAKSGSE